ncbi:ATP-dependent Clp protease ATP-binding subunit ClpC [Candidatus Peregrinibacteria bacterium CG10_big_fil_rev_8_21_14_0_10_49_16]|nr:MAG: ATP-dependent Clp protease ATP-binding subunit ClpC [Candidatus Peregrinibacteria bacterium CG22_combo_CG10-13_8_21_14_all_49_11]PIR51940.1 MAG: ATP-dependent Clp protease ATP-binding subunit ClpC [Candidatus Peregrinibacteria bacterium CG10_big_fil_rev_8_21_14_0_10_49_16]
MHPFDRFTPNAKLALQIAEQEAKTMKSPYIGTEHLLLGLLSIPKSLGFSIFTGAGVTLENARILLKATKSNDIEGQHVKHGLSVFLHNVIEQAVITAHKYRHTNVGTEHLVHALVSTEKNAATILLENMQVDSEELRTRVEEMFGQISQFRQQSKNIEQSLEAFFHGLQGAMAGMSTGMAGMGDPEGLKKKKNTKSKTPVLDYFTDDLIVKAKEKKIDPVIGRDKEIERVIHILSRKTKNNPILIGEPGVGKTAIVEGLAQKISQGTVPRSLKNKRVLLLNMGALVAGTKYRGEFEQRFEDIIKEATQEDTNIILFIDEMHTIVGAGSAEGSLDAANILKPALSRGILQVIGATTTDEFRTIEKDRALARRLQSILVEEPSVEDTLKILRGIKEAFENFHAITISDEALEAAVQFSKRYINERFLPDKAIDVLDEAAAGKKIMHAEEEPEIRSIDEHIEELIQKQQKAVRSQKYHLALKLKQEQQLLKEKKQRLIDMRDGDRRTPISISSDDIAAVISRSTGIPVTKLLRSEAKRLTNLEGQLRKYVIGQDDAIKKVARAIRRSRVGIGDIKRPIGSFLFLGPTGVGKTELVRTVAREVFNREDALIKIDMSEFMERHNVSRLIGTTAGYIGYEEGGQLTEMVRRKPYSVVLFDEVEKAHPEFFNLLLQILEDGLLTDGQGNTVDFTNTVIIMTSNIGAEKLTKQAGKIGFKLEDEARDEEQQYEHQCNEVLTELKDQLRPEFLNRIDHIVIFNALNQEHIRKIVKNQLAYLNERLHTQGYDLQVDQKVVNLLATEGFDPEYGARPVRRVIQQRIEDEIAEHILKGVFQPGDCISVIKKNNDQLDFLPKVKKENNKEKKSSTLAIKEN